MTKKAYVLDTNVLVHDPDSIEAFEENDVIIPIQVIHELDGLKKGIGEVPISARQALKKIDAFRELGNLNKGVALPGGGTLRVFVEIKKHKSLPEKSSDNGIIAAAHFLNNNGHKGRVIIVSKDAALRVKADCVGVPAQDYRKDKSGEFQLFGKVLEGKQMPKVSSVFFRSNDGKIRKIVHKKEESAVLNGVNAFGIIPKNDEQSCALGALTDQSVKVVALTGIAGTGKTLLALAAGLEFVVSRQKYDQVIVGRPTITLGQDLGYLPGDVEEKLEPWMQPIYDNLDVLVSTPRDIGEDKKMGSKFKSSDYLVQSGMIQIEALQYIRGRSLPRRFIIIDEAQNLRPLDVKTLITRCGEGTKIVFTGDLGQIDAPFLDAKSNGLAYLISRFINEPEFCFLNLIHSARSSLAEKAAMLL